MFNLGDKIIFKKKKGIVIDKDNQVIFDDNYKYKVDFNESIFVEATFDNIEDLVLYLEFVSKIDDEVIDIRE